MLKSETGSADPGSNEKHLTLASGIFALILVMGLARFAYTPMLSYMKSGAGVGEALGGWLAGWNYLGYLIGVFLIPFIKTAKLRDTIFVVSLFAAALSTGFMGLTENPALWSAARLIAGIATACGFILASGMMLNWLVRNNHKEELGLMYSGIGIGITLGAVLVETAGLYFGWSGQWLVLGAAGVAIAIPAWAWRPKYIPAPAKTPPITENKAASPQAEIAPSPHKRGQRKPGWLWLLLLQFAYLCSGCAFVVYATFIVIIIEGDPGLKDASVWIWALVGLVAAPSTFIFDLVKRKVGFLRGLAIAFALKGVALLLVIASNSLWAASLSAALFGLTFVSIVSLAMNLAGQRFPENPARYMAILTMSYGVVQVFGPILSGQFAEETGSFSLPLLVCVGLLGLGIICLETMKQMQNRQDRHTHSSDSGDELPHKK